MTFGMNKILAAFSSTAIAFFGIYFKLQSFVFMPVFGLNQGLMPIIGYNYGAREYQRVSKIYRITLYMSGAIMIAGTLICLIASEPLIGMFTSNRETVRAGGTALRIISAGFIVSAVSVTSCGALEGLGKGVQSLVISLCRYALIIIPAAYLLCRIWGPVGVWNAFWVAEAVTAIIALVVYRCSVERPS